VITIGNSEEWGSVLSVSAEKDGGEKGRVKKRLVKEGYMAITTTKNY